ncbi:MAG: RNase adapter RapZ [bacterium]
MDRSIDIPTNHPTAQSPFLLVVSGLSGSGKTVALRALEDMGFYCIDNLPVNLLPELSKTLHQTPESFNYRLAVGIDARAQEQNISQVPKLIQKYKKQRFKSEILYLSADKRCLLKRFSETRRPHPLAQPDQSLNQAIDQELELMDSIALSADLTIDTTNLSVHELRKQLWLRLGEDQPDLSLMVQSFGYKSGVPSDVDYVFDVRCLPNPYWEPALRPFTGKDTCIQDYLNKQGAVVEMLSEILEFLNKQIPRMQSAQRSYLTIGIGCTGGKHRSVFIAEQIAKQLKRHQLDVLVYHRQLIDA